MVAGQPGAGKSAFALLLALELAGTPVLYLSADSSARTQAIRTLAHVAKQEQTVCEQWLDTYPDWAAEQMRSADHVRWSFDSAPTLQDLEEELDAYVTANGEAPHLMIVDNLSDVVGGDGDEFSSLRALMKDLKFLARHYGVCVLALHHVSESTDYKCEPCPPRAAIHGKVSQIPAVILTMSSQEEGSSMWLAPVKNRSGRADKSGRTAMQFVFDPGSMTFTDPMRR